MEEKQLPITFDENSLKIIKAVPSVHRHSLINVALSLVQQTGYYKTLTGVTEDNTGNLESILDLSMNDTISNDSKTSEVTAVTQTTSEVAKKSTSWDDF